jgi:signal transduction histidine kinase
LKTLEQQVIDRTQELVVAHERLQELNQLKTKFIDDVSHELRTPAASISLYLNLLARSHEDKQEAYLVILQESSRRLNQIITSILQFAHLTETAVAQNPSVIDLNKITADVVSQHRPRAQKNGLNLTFLPGADRISSWGIAGLLSQAIDYLLDNAIKYTVDGSVTIRTYLDEDQQLAYVEIKDTGMGIEPDELEQVFERFYRGQHISQLTIPGAGLGLSLAQQIVIQSGGKLEIDSEPGLGTTVRLSVPLSAGDWLT